MKREHAVFMATFCSLLVIALVSLLVFIANEEGTAGDCTPIIWLCEKLVYAFTFPFVLLSKVLDAPIRSMLICYIVDVAIYSAILSYAINKWLNKRHFTY